MQTLYVCGPMTGMPGFNFSTFFAVAGALRGLGYSVENPAENTGTTLREALEEANLNSRPYEYYMRKDIVRLSRCDGVVVLPGWRKSRGANLEVTIARDLGMPLYRFDNFQLNPLVTAIGVSGYARSGKDTIAQHLVAEYGFTRLAFADILRDALYVLNPSLDEAAGTLAEIVDAHGWERAKTVLPEVRQLLQRMGTEVGRDLIHENVWVDAVLRKMEDGGRYVISDVRFPNEKAGIEKFGGEVWRVNRPGIQPANSHPSETALDSSEFAHHIVNDGSVGDLRDAVDKLMGVEAEAA